MRAALLLSALLCASRAAACPAAEAKERSGDQAGALEAYGACLAARRDPAVLLRRGRLRARLGQDTLAVDDFTGAIARDIRMKAAYAERGAAYERLGAPRDAWRDHDRACRLGAAASCPKAERLKPRPRPRPKTSGQGR